MGQVARQARRAPTPALRHVIGSRPPHNLRLLTDVDNPDDHHACPTPPRIHGSIRRPSMARRATPSRRHPARAQAHKHCSQIAPKPFDNPLDFHRSSIPRAPGPIGDSSSSRSFATRPQAVWSAGFRPGGQAVISPTRPQRYPESWRDATSQVVSGLSVGGSTDVPLSLWFRARARDPGSDPRRLDAAGDRAA